MKVAHKFCKRGKSSGAAGSGMGPERSGAFRAKPPTVSSAQKKTGRGLTSCSECSTC